MYFTAFMFSANNSSSGLLSNSDTESGLLSNNNYSENTESILTIPICNGGSDAFGDKDFFGSFELSNLNENFFANMEQIETMGSIAYDSAETIGSVAYATAETIGSVACIGISTGTSCDISSFSSFC